MEETLHSRLTILTRMHYYNDICITSITNVLHAVGEMNELGEYILVDCPTYALAQIKAPNEHTKKRTRDAQVLPSSAEMDGGPVMERAPDVRVKVTSSAVLSSEPEMEQQQQQRAVRQRTTPLRFKD